jgi:hypothetical protein
MRKVLRRVAYMLRQRTFEKEIREEIEVHRAMLQDQLEARGLSPAAAGAESRRALGNATLARENARAVWIAPWLEGMWQDAVYAVRTFRRQPGLAWVPALHGARAGASAP